MRYIPMSIVADILSRLPVKPLLRYKCVSKEWKNLITSQDFIKLHLRRAITSDIANLRLFFSIVNDETKQSDGDIKLYTLDLSSMIRETQKPSNLKPECVPLKHGFQTILVGACNGIFCFRNVQGWGFSLLNPATRTYLKLPDLLEDKQKAHVFSTSWYGFGYDDGVDDYKVVKITQSNNISLNSTKIGVYSWRNKRWSMHCLKDWSYNLSRTDPRLGGGGGDESYRNGTSSNNALHWFVEIERLTEWDLYGQLSYFVVSFDLSTEMFRPLMPLPLQCVSYPSLAAIKGSLYLVLRKTGHKAAPDFAKALSEHKPQQGDPEYNEPQCDRRYFYYYGIDVWMMKDYWVEDSWCRLGSNIIYNNRVFRCPQLIFLSNRRNEILLHVNTDIINPWWVGPGMCISLADLAPGKIRYHVELPIISETGAQPTSQSYVESLVTLDVDEHKQATRSRKRRAKEGSSWF